MWNQRVEEAFTQSDCSPGTKLELANSDYKGPLIDTHFHMSHLWDAPLWADGDGDSYERAVLRGDFLMDLPILGENITMTEIACRLEREGTDSVFAFFFVESERPGQLRPSLEVVGRTMELYPTRFVPFIQPLCCNETVPTVEARTRREYLEISQVCSRDMGKLFYMTSHGVGGVEMRKITLRTLRSCLMSTKLRGNISCWCGCTPEKGIKIVWNVS